MKKIFGFLAVVTILTLSSSSCSKCYVCTDKNDDQFIKTEFCDKDFDKADVNNAMENLEDLGYNCRAKSRAF